MNAIQKTDRVALVILGAVGYMGMNGVRSVAALNRFLGWPLIGKENLLLLDTDLDKPTPSHGWAEAECVLGFKPRAVSESRYLRPYLWGLRVSAETAPIIIYDATPTTFHNGHLTQVAEYDDPNLFYLGEKPIFVDLHDLDNARRSSSNCRFFCELIETENPVFRHVLDYLNSNHLRIEEIWLWRAGASAIKKSIGADRQGVMGGAIEDKSLHDLSITLGWLGGPSQIVRPPSEEELVVEGCENLCPSDRAVLLEEASLLSMDNTRIAPFCNLSLVENGFDRQACPADAMTSIQFDWQLPYGRVPAHYLFSWKGVTESQYELPFRTKWASICNLELPIGSSVETGSLEGIGGPFSAVVRELRIGMIRCSGAAGEQWIVANFLAKNADSEIRRFAKAFGPDKRQLAAIYEDQPGTAAQGLVKTDNLCDIFKTLFTCALGRGEARYIGRESTLLVHEVMLKSQRKLRTGIRAAVSASGSDWWEAAFRSSLTDFTDARVVL
jgi:hypothetical protein